MNIGKFFTNSAMTFPDNLAIAYGAQELSYKEANERINKLANALNELGIKKGDHVALIQYNTPSFLETVFACFKAGIAIVPINHRLHPAEVSYIIDNSEAVAIFLSEEFKEDIQSRRSETPKIKHYVCMSNPPPEMMNYEDLLKGKSSQYEEVEVTRDDVAWIFYTSGTTGRPKGAMLTHGNLLAMTMNYYADLSPLGPDDAILHGAPLSHGSGLYALPNIAKAAANVILESKSFEAKAVCETIEKRKITNMFMAPTMIKILITSPDIGKYDLSSLHTVTYGGAPMYVEDLKEAVQKMGQIFVQIYGQAECPMTISYLRKEEHLVEGTEKQMRRLSSAGITRTDIEIKIVDEGDNIVAPGVMGEIACRGEEVMKGYWEKPEATAESLKGGWLHTGDLGLVEQDGYLYIMDRAKDMIISGGENIYSREVEDVILEYPAVHEVAVIGVPDDYWGEAVKAVVVLKGGIKATDAEIIDFCKNNMSSYKKPKTIEFIDSLPKNSYGKVLKTELREKYWKDRDRKV